VASRPRKECDLSNRYFVNLFVEMENVQIRGVVVVEETNAHRFAVTLGEEDFLLVYLENPHGTEIDLVNLTNN
jgi:hypothetical protein